MFLSTIASVLSIGAGINGIAQSNRRSNQSGSPQDAATAADPFRAHRPYFGLEAIGQYESLQRFNPNEIENDPEYQFQLDQGIGAINKGAAASGMLGSGTRLLDLQKMGQGLASGFADRQYNRRASLLQMLGGFSGATTGSPAGAANALTQGQNSAYSQQQSGLGNIMSGLGGLSRGNWFGGSGGGIGNPNPPDPSNGGAYGPW